MDREEIKHTGCSCSSSGKSREILVEEEEKQMASVAALPSLYSSISRSSRLEISLPSSSSTSSLSFLPRTNKAAAAAAAAANRCHYYLTAKRKNFHGIITRVNAVEEETGTTLATESVETAVSEQPVSVPVSPSDILTMFFQAEGTMNDSDVPKVTSALENIEGVSDLEVRIEEGIATVELTKQTTVQATGVASNLVEVIQGSGFKLQTLNLSFKDEEDNIDIDY